MCEREREMSVCERGLANNHYLPVFLCDSIISRFHLWRQSLVVLARSPANLPRYRSNRQASLRRKPHLPNKRRSLVQGTTMPLSRGCPPRWPPVLIWALSPSKMTQELGTRRGKIVRLDIFVEHHPTTFSNSKKNNKNNESVSIDRSTCMIM